MDPIYTMPLDTCGREIRLLELLPADSLHDPIQCKLYATQLSMETEYTALSYVWGDPKATSPITVNNLPFQATHDLCAALRRIRSKFILPTTLWVDAICINQSDNDEKSLQVQLMRDIYHTASLVTVWLGESDKYSDEAMAIIKLTASLVECISEKGETQVQYCMRVGASALCKDDSRFIALREFFSRPWWSRVWVVQEVVVSRHAKILCGTREMRWKYLQHTFLLWAVLDSRPDDGGYGTVANDKLEYLLREAQLPRFLTLFYYRDLQHDQVVQDGKVGSFPQLSLRKFMDIILLEGQFFESSDPRDKVYAWLGIFRLEREDVAIVPDYHASTAQVYVNALKTVVHLTGSLSLMVNSAGLDQPQSPIPEFPSWAPDFRREYLGETCWGDIVSCSASASELARAAFSPDGKILSADTAVIDCVHLTDAGGSERQGREVAEKLCRWVYLVLQHQMDVQASTAKSLFSREQLPLEFFEAIACPDHVPPQDDGESMLKYLKAKRRRVSEELRAGFMAYTGYLDRMQDVAQWCKEHDPPDCSKHHYIAAVRPGALNICHRRSNRR